MSTALVTGGGRARHRTRYRPAPGERGVESRSDGAFGGPVRGDSASLGAARSPPIPRTCRRRGGRARDSAVARAERGVGPDRPADQQRRHRRTAGAVRRREPEDWWKTLEVNLRGPYPCCRAVLPEMIARGSRRIVNMASGAGTFPIPNMSAYVASKTALIRLSEQLAIELKPHGINVFPIRPGVVRTAMVEEAQGSSAH